MGDAIREQFDDDQDQREEFLVEYQEETQMEIQDIQLELACNKILCRYTQDAQRLLVTPTEGMAYIQGTATKITFCIGNAQHPLIIDIGAHCLILAINYLNNHFPNWEKLSLTKAKDI
ncbi:hypothetical protein O181_044106 [Austropuccinia psidii MF-1]|uniref:Uncharacterized protein n=1 Tax=Austropuccinia psidii MF-1 TaxID=1389203 RepID=A0A9Q3DHW3_9BASI|nr:hypothetical protein [Austropuccinia psidii MF-1]